MPTRTRVSLELDATTWSRLHDVAEEAGTTAAGWVRSVVKRAIKQASPTTTGATNDDNERDDD